MKNNFFTPLAGWLRTNERIIWLEYSALAFVILLPLLTPGYILTLDLVFTPHFAWPSMLTNTAPLDALLWTFGHALPGDVTEKIVLFAILLLSGVGMHRLMRTLLPDTRRLAAYAAGIFYVVNPFTYDRFMAGHWLFLLGYALTPFFARSLFILAAKPAVTQGVRAGGWAFAVVTASIHHLLIVGLVGVAVLVAAAFRYRRSIVLLRRLALGGFASLAAFGLLASFWLVPALLGHSPLAHSVAGFNEADFAAFATDGGSFVGRVANVIRLQGFWVESQQLFTLPQSAMPAWGILFLVAWIVMGMGAVALWRRSRLVAGVSIALIVAGILLAATPLIRMASSLLPFLAGYREPQKFVALIALGFALLFGFGAARLARRTQRPSIASAATIGIVTLPLLLTPVMLWGFAGQLTPRQYPDGWHAANKYLNETAKPGEQALFLPWHQYASYGFSGRLIANPAGKFFEVPTVISDDPEFAGISPTLPNPLNRHVAALLAKQPANIAEILRSLGIRYVILAHEQTWQQYHWLATKSGVHAVQDNAHITLYRLEDTHE